MLAQAGIHSHGLPGFPPALVRQTRRCLCAASEALPCKGSHDLRGSAHQAPARAFNKLPLGALAGEAAASNTPSMTQQRTGRAGRPQELPAIRRQPGSVKYAKDFDGRSSHAVRNQVSSFRNHQLARSRYSAGPSNCGLAGQHRDRIQNSFDDKACRVGVVDGDEVCFLVKVCECLAQPPKLHSASTWLQGRQLLRRLRSLLHRLRAAQRVFPAVATR